MQMRKLLSCVFVVALLVAGPVCPCCGSWFGPIAEPAWWGKLFDFRCPTCGTTCSTASPFFVKTGNYRYAEADLMLSGRGPLVAAYRTYNSHDRYVGPVGKGWHHSLILQAVRMKADNGQFVMVRLPSGMRVLFTKAGEGYSSPLGHYEILSEDTGGGLRMDWPSGDVWRFAPDGWIDTITDRNGNSVTFTYGTIGTQKRPISVQGAGGQRLDIAWGSAGRIRSITDQAGRTINYSYDDNANLQTVEDPGGRFQTYTYSMSGQLALLESVQFQGITVASATYDTQNRLIAYMEDGRNWTIDYQTDRTIKRDAAGKEWQYFFDSIGVVTKVVDPLSAERTFTYHADYLRESVTLEDGSRVGFANGGMGRVSAITRTVGESSWTWWSTYDPQWSMQPAKILGPTGWGGAAFSYDASGNLSAVNRVQGDNTTEETLYTIERNQFGDVTAIADAAGARTDYEYNGTGQLIRITLPPNNSVGENPVYELAYDAAGRVNRMTDPAGRVTSSTYDALDRLIQLTLPDPGTGATGFTRAWTYDELSAGAFRSTVSDLNGLVTSWVQDVWGNTTKITDSAGSDTTIAWADGVAVEIVDANHNTTYYQYDDLHRLKKILHPEGTATEYTYSLTGQLATCKDRKNQTAVFGYDALTRLNTRTYPEGAITYEYDGPRLANVRDNLEGGGEKVTTFVYDNNQRLTGVTNDRGTVEYSWQAGDRLGGYRVGTGPWVSYGYYSSGDLRTIQREGDATPFEYSYDLGGDRESLRYPNGSQVAYTWDNLGRLLTLTNLNALGGLISRYSYDYDRDWASGQYTKKGLAVSMSEELPGTAATLEKYYFDTLYRLTRADYADGSHNEWTYDPLGHRLSTATYPPEGEPAVRNYTWYPNGSGSNSQLLQSDGLNTYAWDANGNMATKTAPDGISYYTWDSLDRLKTITAPSLSASYNYDFSIRRTRKTVNGIESVYQYAGWDLASETVAGQTTDYVFGSTIDEILNMRISGAAEYFYYSDALGSVRQIQDAAGTLANSYSYDVWGEVRQQQVTVANSFLFAGREAGEDGLSNYRFRYYQPSIGSFISEDPLRFASSDPSFYRYGSSNPVGNVDPMGLAATLKRLSPAEVAAARAEQEQVEMYGDLVRDSRLSVLDRLSAAIGWLFGQVDCSGMEYMPSPMAMSATGTATARAGLQLARGQGLFNKLNRLKKDLTLKDLQGALGDLKGNPVINPNTGRPWDHLKEVKDAQKGLLNTINKLKGQVGDPTLTNAEREQVQKALSEASKLLDASEGYVPRN